MHPKAMPALLFAAAAFALCAAEAPKDRLIRRLEAIRTESVRMAWDDMCARWPDRFEKNPEWLRTLESRRRMIITALKGDWGPFPGQPPPLKGGELLLAEIRERLLSNPLLDCDKLLVIRRRQGNLGLHNNWKQPRDIFGGCPNELGILSNLRKAVPSFAVLDATAANGYIGEVCLKWDAKTAMYTRRAKEQDHPPRIGRNRGVENIHRVVELDLAKPGSKPVEIPLIPDKDVNCYAGCYLPDGAILFISDATMVGVPCVVGSSWVGNIYRREPDGAIRRLTFDQDHNWCVNLMPDGRVMYLRWEYSDITHYAARILFTMNPDGTVQRAYYGSNSYWPNALFNARSCPDAPDSFTAVVTGHHGQPRFGELVLFDTLRGRKDAKGVVQRFPERGKPVEPIVRDRVADYSWPKFCHPYPLSKDYVIVAARPTEKDDWGLYLADSFDNLTPIAEDKANVYMEPIPLQAVKRPPVIASKVDTSTKTARVKVTDIYDGPGLDGVPRGTVKGIRIYTYSFAYRWMGAEVDHHGLDGPWDIKRIVGTVPVESDGSAYFTVPANLPLSFQPLDADGRALQLMRSWTTVMPGELASCSGCHEENEASAGPNRRLVAMDREPSEIKPWHGPERGFSFRREVQPVLDRYCVSCHDGKGNSTNLIDVIQPGLVKKPDLRDRPDVCIKTKETYYMRDGLFPPAYLALCSYVRNATQEGDNALLVPGETAADTTALVHILEGGHHGVRLDEESWDRLATWIDLNRMGKGTWTDTVGTNRVEHFAARRAEMQRRYANLAEDQEKTYGRAVIKSPALPRAKSGPRPDARAKAAALDGSALPVKPVASRTLDLGGGVKIALARIPAGTLVDSSGRKVSFAKPFWMSVDEVTNEQYRRLVPTHDSRLERGEFMQFTEQERGYPLNLPDQPVVRVSCEQAAAYCAELSRRTGAKVRLPAGDEWEWAARAGASTPLWYGDLDADFSKCANLADATFRRQDRLRGNIPASAVPPWRPSDVRFDDHYRVSAPVASFEPNAWGLRNVHGNVWEWTSDRAAPSPFGPGKDTTPRAVVRGGSCWSRPKDATFASRLLYRPWRRLHDVGFRILVED